MLVVGLIGMGALLPARAQQSEVTVTASARPMTAGTSETITYTIEVEGAPLSMVDTPEPPPTSGLALQRPTPSTQRSVSFANGQLNRSVTFRWDYEPVRAGTGRFEPTTVTVRGAPYDTEVIEVTIVPQSQRPAQPPTGSATRLDPSDPDPESSALIGEDDLFIRGEASSRRIYQNEQVLVTYRLYFREGIQLRHSRLATAWDATGFWREELDVESRPIPQTTRIDGRRYQTIVLKRAALFPTRTGSLRVDPLEIETEARATARLHNPSDPFSSLRSSYESLTRSSNPLTIDVRPLPGDPPAAFNGAVGSFQIHTDVDEREVTVGRAVQMSVRLHGAGNIATLEPPTFTPPDAVDAYDPKVKTSVKRNGMHIKGAKTFTYALIPQRSGTLTLPPVTFAYFDPDRGRYETLRSSPAKIDVTEPDPPASDSTDDRLAGSDAAESVARWTSASKPLYLNPWAYAAVLVPLLLAGGVLAYWRRTENSDTTSTPRRSVPLADRLEPARRHLRAGSPDAFYDTLERAVLGFIGERLGAAPSGLTRSRLDRALADHDVPERIRAVLFELLDVCDRVRFSPAQSSESGMRQALHRAQKIIDYLDDHLPDSPSS